MNETRKIISLFESLNSDSKVVLATVVKVYGSAYRRPGARMLITGTGNWIGTISGGCLEGDALKQAKKCLLSDKPMIVTYDTRDDSNAKVGANLGCNGVIDVLLEPVNSDSPIIKFLKSYTTENKLSAHALVIHSGKNDFFATHYFNDSENHNSNPFTSVILDGMRHALETGLSFNRTEAAGEDECEVFYELLKPNLKLIIFGSGFDSYPIIKLAKLIGWDVQITSDSYSITDEANFEGADIVKYCDRDEIAENFHVDDRTVCLLISHNYKYDSAVLKALINTDTPYIGILGPKKRLEKIREEFDSKGINLNEKQLERIYNPAGLNIGGDTPEELALSMLAEIQAVINSKTGGFLKGKEGRIHE